MKLFRIEPQLPAAARKTYELAAPPATHFRPASCADVDCPAMAHGWRTIIDERTDLGEQQGDYIRRRAGRSFTAELGEDGLTTFTFAAGQQCFRAHLQPLEREPLYLVHGGDWRGDPARLGTRQHTRPDDWVDDFATHQQTLADRAALG